MRILTKTAGIALALVLSASAATDQVVASSKIDTKGGVLGNLILADLNAHGIPTDNRVQLGATQVVRAAITAGRNENQPEYTGNAAFFYEQAGTEEHKSEPKS